MLSNSLALIIFMMLVVVQCILAINMRMDLRRWGRKYNFTLSSQMRVVDMLAKFSTLHKAVNIKVSLDFPEPAKMTNSALAVSKSSAHQRDFYSCYYALHVLLGNLSGYYWWLNLVTFLQKVAFAGQFIFLFLALIFAPALAILAIALAMVPIFLTIVIEIRTEKFNLQALHYAVDLLDLDQVEHEQATKVINAFSGAGYWYVLFPWKQLWLLFKPAQV